MNEASANEGFQSGARDRLTRWLPRGLAAFLLAIFFGMALASPVAAQSLLPPIVTVSFSPANLQPGDLSMGTVTITNPNGTFSFRPNNGFLTSPGSPLKFQFKIKVDGVLYSEIFTVSIVVAPPTIRIGP